MHRIQKSCLLNVPLLVANKPHRITKSMKKAWMRAVTIEGHEIAIATTKVIKQQFGCDVSVQINRCILHLLGLELHLKKKTPLLKEKIIQACLKSARRLMINKN